MLKAGLALRAFKGEDAGPRDDVELSGLSVRGGWRSVVCFVDRGVLELNEALVGVEGIFKAFARAGLAGAVFGVVIVLVEAILLPLLCAGNALPGVTVARKDLVEVMDGVAFTVRPGEDCAGRAAFAFASEKLLMLEKPGR